MYFNQFIYFNISVVYGKAPSKVQYSFRPAEANIRILPNAFSHFLFLIALMPNIFYIFGINCATFSCQWYFFAL